MIPHKKTSAASVNATLVDAGARVLGTIHCINTNAAVRYLKIYDKATAPSEADTPVQVYAIPGNAAGAGFTLPGIELSLVNGLGYRITTGVADNNTDAVAANEITLNLLYR